MATQSAQQYFIQVPCDLKDEEFKLYVLPHLKDALKKKCSFLINDHNERIQKFLHQHTTQVTVYHTGSTPQFNVGNFPTKGSFTSEKERDAAMEGASEAVLDWSPLKAENLYSIYLKHADEGNAEGQFNVGVCYLDGMGVEKDPAKAVQWFYKAAAQNHPIALYNLGLHCANGIGVKKDVPTAWKLFIKSAKLGCSQAKKVMEYLISHKKI